MRVHLLTAVALTAGLLTPLSVGVSPAAAHGTYTSITDSDTADVSSDPTINGIPMKVRVLRPTQTKPTGGWPVIVYMAGLNRNRCANINEYKDLAGNNIASWYTRKALAEHGYAVISFNPRGMPASQFAGANAFGGSGSGCAAAADAVDGTNDSGWDFAGPTDKADVSALIDWAVANYTYSGCSSGCLDGTKVGLVGEGYHGLLAWLMPAYDSQVKAVVPIGTSHLVRNVKNISKDPTADVHRPVELGWDTLNMADSHAGQWGLSDPSVMAARETLVRTRHLNPGYPAQNATGAINVSTDPKKLTVVTGTTFSGSDVGVGIEIPGAGPSGATLTTTIDGVVNATTVRLTDAASTTVSSKTVTWSTAAWAAKTFHDARTVLDDDDAVDKAHSITTPIFVVHGFLDGAASTAADTEAYNRIPGSNTEKYLYLGACGAFPAPCRTNDANALQDKVHRFLDRNVRGESFQVTDTDPAHCGTSGPCVFRAVPSATPFSTDFSAISESTAWPIGSKVTACLGWDGSSARGEWTTCQVAGGPPTGKQVARDLRNERHKREDPSCIVASGFAANETFEYDSATVTGSDARFGKSEADVWMSSNTTRMQVYVELRSVNASTNIESTISQYAAVHVPVVRPTTAGTNVRMLFQPTGAAATIPVGHKVRVVIASKQIAKLAGYSAYKRSFGQEEIPGTYTVRHTDATPTKLSLWWF